MNLIYQDTTANVEDHAEYGGPEYNLGKTFSRRFTFQKEDGTYITYEFFAYVQGSVVDHECFPLEDAMDEDLSLPNYFAIGADDYDKDAKYLRLDEVGEVWITEHTDPEDISGSETFAHMEILEVGTVFQSSMEKSESVCRNYINSLDAEQIAS